MNRIIAKILSLAVMAVALVACSDDNDPTTDISVINPAVLMYNDASACTFYTTNPSTGSLITLSAGIGLNSETYKTGDCFLIQYYPTQEAGKIDLLGIQQMTNVKASIVPAAQIEGWDDTPVYLLSYAPMFDRLIIYAGLPFSDQKRKLGLLIDESTLKNDVVDAYIQHSLSDTDDTFRRNYYIAFNLADVLNKNVITKMRVHVNNSNLPDSTFEIDFSPYYLSSFIPV